MPEEGVSAETLPATWALRGKGAIVRLYAPSLPAPRRSSGIRSSAGIFAESPCNGRAGVILDGSNDGEQLLRKLRTTDTEERHMGRVKARG